MIDELLYADQATIIQFIISSFIYTYGLGLAVPIFIRYLLIRKPLNNGISTFLALLNSATFWIISFLIIQSQGDNRNPSPVWITAIFFIARWIMSRGNHKKNNASNTVNVEESTRPFATQSRIAVPWPFILLIGFICGIGSVILFFPLLNGQQSINLVGENETNGLVSTINQPPTTNTIVVRPTNTRPIINTTATSEARKTATISVVRTATAQSVATAETASNLVNTWALDTNLVFGPVSETLNVEAENASLPYWWSGLEVRDFFTEVTFHNPPRSSTERWGYGFGFRDNGFNSYRIHINSNKDWYFERVYNLNSEAPQFELINRGKVPSLNILQDETNTMLLVAKDDEGFLFVNNYLVTTLNLAEVSSPGDVWVASGFHRENIVPDRAVKFEQFSVWKLN